MGFLDNLINKAESVIKSSEQATKNAVNKAATNIANNAANNAQKSSETFTFAKIPETLQEMQALPEATLDSPFKAAALTILALCNYPINKDVAIEMLNWLKGPSPLSPREISFINDRFMDGADYVPRSYFNGATPENDYTPSEPFTLVISAGPYAYQDENYAKLDIRSGGADSPRQIQLRKKGDGHWFLWEQFVLSGIRQPKSADPWA